AVVQGPGGGAILGKQLYLRVEPRGGRWVQVHPEPLAALYLVNELAISAAQIQHRIGRPDKSGKEVLNENLPDRATILEVRLEPRLVDALQVFRRVRVHLASHNRHG